MHKFKKASFCPFAVNSHPHTSGYWPKTIIHPSRDISCKFKYYYTLKNIFLFSFFQRGTTFCRRLCISDLTVFVNSIFWVSHFLLLWGVYFYNRIYPASVGVTRFKTRVNVSQIAFKLPLSFRVNFAHSLLSGGPPPPLPAANRSSEHRAERRREPRRRYN